MNGARLGFTLVEIAVVLLILGIAAAVVAPALPPAHRPADDEARSLLRQVSRAQRLAVERETTVEFRLARSSYALVERSAWGDSVSVLGRGTLWPSNLSTNGSWAIQFDAGGRPHGEKLSFVVPAGDARLDVDRWSGRAIVRPVGTTGVHAP